MGDRLTGPFKDGCTAVTIEFDEVEWLRRNNAAWRLLRADNTDTLVRLLEAEHGIRAERQSPTKILLTSRP